MLSVGARIPSVGICIQIIPWQSSKFPWCPDLEKRGRKSNVAMFCFVFLIQQRNRFKALKSKQIFLVPPPTSSCKFTLGIHHSRLESHTNASLVNIPQDSRIIQQLSCTFLCVRKYKKDVISPGEDRYTNNYNTEQNKIREK